jgi:hypothetical protein
MAAQSPLTLHEVITFAWQGPADPDLSADGQRVAYAHEGAVWWVDTTGGDPAGGNAVLAREFGGRPWEVPEVYQQHNPLTRLHHARTPTLILRGELDGIVGAQVLYTWLHQLGVEVELIKYVGEGHVLQKPEHRRRLAPQPALVRSLPEVAVTRLVPGPCLLGETGATQRAAFLAGAARGGSAGDLGFGEPMPVGPSAQLP